jgi:hypothetical protein
MKTTFYILKRLQTDLDKGQKPYYEYLENNLSGLDMITTYKDKAKRFAADEVEKNGVRVSSKGWKCIRVTK